MLCVLRVQGNFHPSQRWKNPIDYRIVKAQQVYDSIYAFEKFVENMVCLCRYDVNSASRIRNHFLHTLLKLTKELLSKRSAENDWAENTFGDDKL